METDPLDVRIAARIAAHEGTDPMALDPPLHEAVDVDALEALFQSPHEGTDFTGSVSFEYCGHTVTVEHTGAVSVTQSAERRPRGDASGPAVAGPDR